MSRWLEHLLHEGALTAPTRGFFAWVVVSAFVLVILAVCGLVPSISELTGMRFAESAALFAPLPALALIDNGLRRSGSVSALSVSRVLSFLGNFLVELYPAVIIGRARFVGAALFAAFYLLTVLVHAQLFRVSPRFPFWLLAFVLEAAISLTLNHDDHHVAVWALLLPAAVTSAVVAGNAKLREDQQRAELLSTRTALAAQLLEIEAQRGATLEERIDDLLGAQHDMKSPIGAALLDVGFLTERLRNDGHADLLESLGNVRSAVMKLRDRLKSAHQMAREQAAAQEAKLARVDVAAVAAVVVARAARTFRDVKIVADAIPSVEVRVAIGAETLERILENIVTNACEGDGTRGATRVSVAVTFDGAEDEEVVVTVRDNGPGFSQDALARQIQAQKTTKANGTGLGLFTAERLARASGACLERTNNDAAGAGAVVTVRLRRAAG